MKYHLAQLNIAQFRLPPENPVNNDFINNLDRVNAIAESQQGFIWRMVGNSTGPDDLHVFDDPDLIVNMSVWDSIESLSAFAYRNKAHREIMRRKAEWFEELEFYLVLWWVKEGHLPDLIEAKDRLECLVNNDPTKRAFTFKDSFHPPK